MKGLELGLNILLELGLELGLNILLELGLELELHNRNQN